MKKNMNEREISVTWQRLAQTALINGNYFVVSDASISTL